MSGENRQPHDVDLHVGRRVRARRKAIGQTQEALGDALGLTFQQVQKYERGANRISASKLVQIALSQETPVAWYFEGLDAAGQSTPAADLVDSVMSSAGGLELLQLFTALPEDLRGSLVAMARHHAEAVERAFNRPRAA